MASLLSEFDKVKTYETGVDQVVLYLYNNSTKKYDQASVWNGVTKITMNREGADANEIWADNIKYLVLRAVETLGLNLEAYGSPAAFDACDGTASLADGVTIGQQKRVTFGLCFRTKVGNDSLGDDYAYKRHLVYGCTASPSSMDYNTINDSPDPGTLSWDIDTVPVPVTGHKNTSDLTINSAVCTADQMQAIEDVLFGTTDTDAYLPLPDEVLTIMTTD